MSEKIGDNPKDGEVKESLRHSRIEGKQEADKQGRSICRRDADLGRINSKGDVDEAA